MKTIRTSQKVLLSLAFFILVAVAFSAQLIAQDQSWQVMRADYGYKSQRNDVTARLMDLLQGAVNGRIAVNNETMGGDPAVGADKTLHIFARNQAGEEREFDYKEHTYLETGIFALPRADVYDRRRSADPGDRNYPRNDGPGPGDYGARNRQDSRGLSILWGFYGVQGRTVNVTGLLQDMVRNGVLTLDVNNNSLGGDPAIGADKILIVVYRYQGREQAAAVSEGNRLTIP